MKWIVSCIIVVNVCTFCRGNGFDDFRREKEEFLQKLDELFDSLYFEKHPHELSDSPASADSPLPSPDWSSEEPENVGGDPDDPFWYVPSNYLPPEDNDGPRRDLGDSERELHAGSGSGDGDDEDSMEGLGSGDETATTKSSVELTTESVTSEPTTTDSVDAECGAHLKAEVRSCVEMALNVRWLVAEMGHLVQNTGYYNVSTDSSYFVQFFRVCTGSILTPPRCSRDDGKDGVVERATAVLTELAYQKHGPVFPVHEAENFNCFRAHLFSLKTCIGTSLTNQNLEALVRTVILQDKRARIEVCRAFRAVQVCFVSSMGWCVDYTSKVLVDEMFEVALKKVTTCLDGRKPHRDISSAITLTPLGTAIMLAIGILTARLL